MAADQPDVHVPVIDIGDPSATERAALDAACREHGFFLLRGHDLDELIDQTWAETARFFDADRAVREAIVRDAENPFGWFDRELTKRRRDHKEVFDFVDPTHPKIDTRNRWPELDGFKASMAEFYDAMAVLAGRTVGLLHDLLELDDADRAAMNLDRYASSVRLNHYPVGDPVPEAERGELVGLGETALGLHTDPGTLTLLLQDDTGGLQTRTRSGDWLDVPPIPGTIVVNLADAVQVWTNDRYVAAVHRVVPMTERRRFSIPFFGNPTRGTMVEPLASVVRGEGGAAKYRAFDWSDFIRARQDDNFVDAGAEDAQISDYLLA